VAPEVPSPVSWNGAYFVQNEASMELTSGDTNDNGTDTGGTVLQLKIHHASFSLPTTSSGRCGTVLWNSTNMADCTRRLILATHITG
jgi:hypothetical protein